MFTLEFTYRFETAHRFTQGSTKCTTPHGHTWRATLGFRSPAEGMGEAEMVEEFEALKSNWRAFLSGTVDHSFLHHYRDPLLPALRDHIPGFRGLGFPGDPTTEMLASFFLRKAIAMRRPGGLEPSFVTVEETPTNRLTFDREGLAAIALRFSGFHGWWEDADPASRRFEASPE